VVLILSRTNLVHKLYKVVPVRPFKAYSGMEIQLQSFETSELDWLGIFRGYVSTCPLNRMMDESQSLSGRLEKRRISRTFLFFCTRCILIFVHVVF